MRPSDIRYSQDSISCEFGAGKTIWNTLDKLEDGIMQVTDLPKIRVCKKDGKWYTADNRRLWLFKNLESSGKLNNIAVIVGSFDTDIGSKFTTENDGTSIRVRNQRLDFDDDYDSEGSYSDDDDFW